MLKKKLPYLFSYLTLIYTIHANTLNILPKLFNKNVLYLVVPTVFCYVLWGRNSILLYKRIRRGGIREFKAMKREKFRHYEN